MKTLLVLFFAAPAWGQLQLYVVDSNSEHVAPSLYDFGSVYANQPSATQFRLRNTSNSPAAVTTLTISGAGFSLSATNLPVTLAPQAALDFTVSFRSPDTGTYSAALRSDGVSILLTATVLPSLTLSGTFDFGSVVRGTSVQQRFTLTNQTPQVLIVPAIAIKGTDFSFAGTLPSGQAYQPQQSGEFLVNYSPAASGPSQATLSVGGRSYTLTGLGIDPPLPKPFLTVDLKQVASAQQGLVIIRFDAPAKSSATGALNLDFRGPSDPTVVFASGQRIATYPVAPGDTQVSIPFQTGTTAGTIIFTTQLGSSSDQLSVAIPASPAGIATAQGTRSASSVDVAVSGFDNTRTLGALSFTFYDAAGNALAPGTIRADATAQFSIYFSTSQVGGGFLFHAVFPVTGDTARIAACDVTLSNSAGSSKAPRIAF